ncbi:MAG: hypothetical protein GY707_02165 [Desulfobacteraceae bacterium]|nr:hypothetical protein [Desulfobacteraceae bacterium]
MDTEQTDQETIENFKKSFFYGSRSDMNFKFLSKQSDEEVGVFFQKLLQNIAIAYDNGTPDALFDFVTNAQEESYSKEVRFANETGPFTPMKKSISKSNVLLLTTSGHFAKGDDPKPLGVDNMTQQEAQKRIMEFIKEEPALSAIPRDIAPKDLMVRHGGYDISGAKSDPNVVFPLDLLKNLEQKKQIGKLAENAFSFVGACSQKRLMKKTGPKWVTQIKGMDIDAALLIPV